MSHPDSPSPHVASSVASPFAHFGTLMRRVMALFWLFAGLLGVLVTQQYWVQRQAEALTQQSRQTFGEITQVRLRMSDLLDSLILFKQLQNPELLAPRVACGALCEHLPRLARHAGGTPQMRESLRRAQVWDARLTGSLDAMVAAARDGAPAEEVEALVTQAQDVELAQLRRKIDEIAYAEVNTFGERQAAAAASTRQLLVALGLLALAAAVAVLWLQRQARRVAQEGLRAEQAVRALALHDELTGLPNRRMLAESAPLLLNRARRHRQAAALMMVDLDGFKQVNDRHGHAAGDALLQEMAERMRATLREGDLLVRLGGDEFVVLLDGSASAAEVLRVGQRLVSAVCRPVPLPGGAQAAVSASIGLACFPADGQHLDALLAAADGALYSAKRAGRNRLCRAGNEPVAHVLAPLPPESSPETPEESAPLASAGNGAVRPAPERSAN